MRKTLYRIAGTVMLFLALSNAVSAQEKPIADTAMLQEVVVTASKTPQSRGNVTQRIDILTPKEIDTYVSGGRNISDALQYQPGASVTVLSRNDANWGTFDGIGPKYSTYMLQGLPVDGYMDPMNLDLSAVSRIEIQRGPASVLYPGYLSQDFAGSQSPLAGTVNLILRERIDERITRAAISAGSYNTLNGRVYHQDFSGNIHYFAGLNHEMSDYTNYGADGSWLNMQKDPEYRKTKIYGGLAWFSGDGRHRLKVFANKTIHTGDAGRIYRGFGHNYGIINAGYAMRLSDRVTLQTNMGYRSYDRSWQESRYNVTDSLVSDNGVVQQIVPADISLTFRHGHSGVLTAGVDYQGADYRTWTDPLQGYQTIGNKSKATLAGIYLQEEMIFGKFVVRAGARGNYTDSRVELLNGGNAAQKTGEWMKFIYSAGLKYKAGSALSIYANAGNSFMTPGLKSVGGTIVPGDTLYNGQLPNPDLQPESGFCADGGADLSVARGFQFSLRGFHIAVNDAIVENVVRQNPSQSMSVNAGKTRSQGVEFGVSQTAGDQVRWFANFTWMQTKVSNPLDAGQDGASIPFAPEIVASAGITWTAPFGLTLTPAINYNDGYYDSSSKADRQKFTPGALISATVSQVVVNRADARVSLFGQFYNITNNRYDMPWQFQNTGFSFMAGLSVEF